MSSRTRNRAKPTVGLGGGGGAKRRAGTVLSGETSRRSVLRSRSGCRPVYRFPSTAGERRHRRLQTLIREMYQALRRERLMCQWGQVRTLMQQNRRLLQDQLAAAGMANSVASALSRDSDDADAPPPPLAEPVEIPQLYNQFGRFESRIGGSVYHVGLAMIPQVGVTGVFASGVSFFDL